MVPARGDVKVLPTRPIAAALPVTAVLPTIRRRRAQVFVERRAARRQPKTPSASRPSPRTIKVMIVMVIMESKNGFWASG
jgi:hypothetical protein